MENSKNTIGIIPDNGESTGYSAKLMRNSSNGNSLILIIFTAFMFGGGFLAQFIAEKTVGESSEYYKCITMIIPMVIQYFIGVPLSIFIYRKTKSGQTMETVGSLFRKPQQSFWWVVRWIFIAIFFIYGTSLATNLLFMLIEALTGVKLTQTDFSAENNAISKVVNILCITFMAPIFEEILIRGGMLNNAKRYGSWSAVIATGLFFGLLHMNYPQVPFAAVMGIVAAFILLKTKSIIPTIVIHFIINSIGGFQSLFVGEIDLEAMQSGDMSAMTENAIPFLAIMACGLTIMGLLAVGLVLFILEIIMHRDSFKLEKVNPEVSEGKKLCHYFSAPLTIILTLFYLAMTVINAIPQ
ncbi:MAG: CPBP family intramembrane metalloprotease [Ruminococcus sp.]|nr:CPBP family intramembrane metalloprotease [Ruminococcus sp.]